VFNQLIACSRSCYSKRSKTFYVIVTYVHISDFSGVEYEKHTKCITEEEKYSGKNFKPKPGANKGEQKQEQWIEVSS
jgi:LYAR-type C2HC zinc finger